MPWGTRVISRRTSSVSRSRTTTFGSKWLKTNSFWSAGRWIIRTGQGTALRTRPEPVASSYSMSWLPPSRLSTSTRSPSGVTRMSSAAVPTLTWVPSAAPAGNNETLASPPLPTTKPPRDGDASIQLAS